MAFRQSLLALLFSAAVLTTAMLAPTSPNASLPLNWELLSTGITDQLGTMIAVSDTVIWIGGGNGTVLLSTNGGTTWKSVGPSPAPAPEMNFHSIAATSATHAAVLARGDGPVYLTTDGGVTWSDAFEYEIAEAYFDSLAFFGPEKGVALSDPIYVAYPTYPGEIIDRKFRLFETLDGGTTWAPIDWAAMLPALPREVAFAASGTCLALGPSNRVYIGTGGANTSRVFRSEDGGHTWNVSTTPIASAQAKGIFSVQFRDEHSGIAVGGDYNMKNASTANAAWTADGGQTWLAPTAFPGGYRSGSAWVPGTPSTAIAVGPTGSDITTDGGRTWQAFSNASFDTVQCPGRNLCFASGQDGRIARMVVG